jgi:hypothetical protein
MGALGAETRKNFRSVRIVSRFPPVAVMNFSSTEPADQILSTTRDHLSRTTAPRRRTTQACAAADEPPHQGLDVLPKEALTAQ